MTKLNALVEVVVAIILRANKVLVAQRPADKPYSGYWEFPGGKIEHDETPLQAIQRELQEELGIEVTDAEVWFEHQHCYPDKTVNLHLIKIKQYKGKPSPQENQGLQWANYEELCHLNLLEGNKPILKQLNALFSDV